MKSRHLGEISLEGGVGGGWLDATIEIGESGVPFRLEIDHPGQFDEEVVRKIDIALDGLEYIDTFSRQTIMGAVRQSDSAPARLYEAWVGHGGLDDFVKQLAPTHMTLLPDGGRNNRDRVVIEYRLPDSQPSAKITVRFRDGIGPELDPAPRG